MIEYRIRRNGHCDYTGSESSVLIQLVDSQGQPSGFIGIEAMHEAFSLLSAMQGIVVKQTTPTLPVLPIPVVMPEHPQYGAGVQEMAPQAVAQTPPVAQPRQQPAPVQPKPQQGGLTQTEQIALRQFRSECEKLLANPPPNHKGEVNGVGDQYIRDIMEKYKAFFSNPLQAMSPTLTEMFGIPAPRLEFFLAPR